MLFNGRSCFIACRTADAFLRPLELERSIYDSLLPCPLFRGSLCQLPAYHITLVCITYELTSSVASKPVKAMDFSTLWRADRHEGRKSQSIKQHAMPSVFWDAADPSRVGPTNLLGVGRSSYSSLTCFMFTVHEDGLEISSLAYNKRGSYLLCT